MRDIFYFFNSKDVASHLKSINYTFSSLECAYIVWQCKHASLKEKHVAYQEIISKMPDSPIRSYKWTKPQESLHKYLEAYMNAENLLIDKFFESETNAVYTYDTYEKGDFDWSGRSRNFYSSFSTCESAFREFADEDTCLVSVSKKWLDNEIGEIFAHFTPNGTLIKIAQECVLSKEDDILDDVFWGLTFDIPVPFKRGDLLQLQTGPFPCNHYAKYFVLEACKRSPFHKKAGVDMLAYCYCTDENGKLIQNHVSSYLNCEYLTDELPEEDIILKALSDLMLGTSDEATFLNTYSDVLSH